MPEAAITCGCGASWTGRTRAHCAACHELFSGVAAFDAHRRGRGGCRPPADVGLVARDGALWGWPGVDDRWSGAS